MAMAWLAGTEGAFGMGWGRWRERMGEAWWSGAGGGGVSLLLPSVMKKISEENISLHVCLSPNFSSFFFYPTLASSSPANTTYWKT